MKELAKSYEAGWFRESRNGWLTHFTILRLSIKSAIRVETQKIAENSFASPASHGRRFRRGTLFQVQNGHKRTGHPWPSLRQRPSTMLSFRGASRVASRMIVNMGGRGTCRAIGLRKLAAQQELRPPGIGRLDHGPKSATAPAGIVQHIGHYSIKRDIG